MKKSRRRIKLSKKRNFKKFTMKFASYMTQGYGKENLKYTVSLGYGIDANYTGGYFLSYSQGTTTGGGTPTYYMPQGSTGTPGGNFNFMNSRNEYSAGTALPIAKLLGSGVAGSASMFVMNFKYWKVAACKITVTNILTLTGNRFLTVPPAPGGSVNEIPSINAALTNLPSVYFNFVDNIGIGTFIPGAVNDQYNIINAVDGEPQRDLGSLRFNPHSTDEKKGLSRTFKFGSWCLPPQQVNLNTGLVSNIQMATIGHWNNRFGWGASDPTDNNLLYINGAMVMGATPIIQLPIAFQNTNYRYGYLNVAQIDLEFEIHGMGKTAWNTVSGA